MSTSVNCAVKHISATVADARPENDIGQPVVDENGPLQIDPREERAEATDKRVHRCEYYVGRTKRCGEVNGEHHRAQRTYIDDRDDS